MLAYIRTTFGVTIMVRGRPVHISHDDRYYQDALNVIDNGGTEEDIYEIVTAVRREVEKACTLSDTIEYSGGVVRYLGQPLHGYAVDKLVALIHANKPVVYLTRFLEKLQLNPSNQTVENLYQFLEYGKMPINERGNFLAYKAVRKDFKDIHSGKFDNSIGQMVEMPRRAVDDNRQQTCSHGLHVCSFEYLQHFASAGGHVVVCEINPADVVSIPADYHNTKMRVCRYTVVGEHEGYYDDAKLDVLGGTETWDEEYDIWCKEEGDIEFNYVISCDDLEEAVELAKEELDYGGDDGEMWIAAKILNANGVVVNYLGAR